MSAMTKKDVQSFVDKLYGCHLSVVYTHSDYDACVDTNSGTIYIDSSFWTYHRHFPMLIESILRHEVGHFNVYHPKRCMRELYAQIWAIQSTKNKRMLDLLRDEILSWDDPYMEKCYQDARRIYFRWRKK